MTSKVKFPETFRAHRLDIVRKSRVRGLLVILFLVTHLFSCSEMGRQAPETQSILVSSDGRFIIRTYSVLFVTSYEKRGGATFRSGSSTHYFQKYDAATGELLKESGKIRQNISSIFISKRLIWSRKLDPDAGEFQLAAYSMEDFSEVLSAEKIGEANPGLRFNAYQAWRLKADENQIVVKGNDARYYKLDEVSGKATPVMASETEALLPVFSGTGWKTDTVRYDFRGSDRRYLYGRTKGKTELRSETDFIQPEIVGRITNKDFLPVSIGNQWFIISSTTTDETAHFLISAIDSASLRTRWTIPMDFNSQPFEKKLAGVSVEGTNLLLIGKQSAGLLDTKTRTWKWKLGE